MEALQKELIVAKEALEKAKLKLCILHIKNIIAFAIHIFSIRTYISFKKIALTL